MKESVGVQLAKGRKLGQELQLKNALHVVAQDIFKSEKNMIRLILYVKNAMDREKLLNTLA